MNYRYVLSQLGRLLLVFSGILLLMGLWAVVRLLFGRSVDLPAMWGLLVSGAFGAVASLGVMALTRGARAVMGRREALLLVALSWIVGAALAALPYLLWAHTSREAPVGHPFRNFVDCYFESVSGLTTTGASVLEASGGRDIESIPGSLLMWRGVTQWLGGIGIVVLFVAVLPSLGVGGKKLYRVEAGPSKEGLQPQIRETVRTLLYIYLALSAAQILLLTLAGMGLSDAASHTFATLATGGFSPRNASVGAYRDRPAVALIIVVFMILGAVNFALYFQLLRGKGWNVLRDVELRLFLVLLGAGSLIVWVAIARSPIVLTTGETVGPSAGLAAAEAIFTTVSIQTTTGFCTSDFNRWPWVAQAVLVVLMFVGSCSGSTAGGLKVIRLWIVIKVMVAEIECAFRPSVIRPVKVADATVDDSVKLATATYALGMLVLLFAGAAAVMLLEQYAGNGCTFATAAGASVATLCTIGPGLEAVGAAGHYGWLTGPSKIVLAILMIVGRLEIFAIIVLFSPRYWRGN